MIKRWEWLTGFWERYGIDKENFHNTYKVEEIAITSSYENHAIPADYIYAAQSNSSKNYPTVILVHGMGDNRYSNYPIAEFFLEKGYNIVTYDQRSTNENTAQYTTFGYREKYDLIDYVNYVEQQRRSRKLAYGALPMAVRPQGWRWQLKIWMKRSIF